MKRPRQHEIDEEAKLLFRSKLPRGWVIRDQIPDYGIDYLVETRDDEQRLTGKTFAVQLKGTKRLKIVEGKVHYRLATDYLAYYVDKRRDPVFLVVADIVGPDCYWLFTQKHALTVLHGRNWREQRSITLHIPLENRLDDSTLMDTVVEEAERYMNRLRPASISTSIEAEKRKWESLDPRFSIDITADGKSVHHRVAAKENVEFTLSITGKPEDVRDAAERLTDQGLPVDLSNVDIEATGSALFSEIIKNAQSIHWKKMFDVVFEIYSTEEDSATTLLASLGGTVEGGHKKLRAASEVAGCPFTLRFPVKADDIRSGDSVDMHMGFDPCRWGGYPLRQLPYFDQIHRLFVAIAAGRSLSVQCVHKGNRLFRINGAPNDDGMKQIANLLNDIAKAREIANVFDVMPTFPSALTATDLEQIHRSYWLAIRREVREPAEGWEIKGTIGRDGAQNLLRTRKGNFEPAPLRLLRDGETIELFGTPIDLPAIEIIVTAARLQTPLDEIRTALSDPSADEIAIRWKGTAGAEMIRRPQQAPGDVESNAE